MKRNLTILIALASIILAGCPASKSSTDVITLKLNLEKGKTYSYGTSTHFDMNMEVSGQKMATGLDMAYTYKIALDHADSSGNQVLNSTIDAIKFKAAVMGMSMGYDSKEVIDTSHQDAMSGMFRKIFSGMLGKSFKITIGPTGSIVDVSGVEEMITNMINGFPGTDEEKEKMKAQLNQSFNKEQVKQTFAQAFNLYPDKPVKIGDSWKKEVELGMKGMSNTQEITYKVKDITSSTVVLDLKGDIKSSEGAHSDSTATAPAMNLNGSESGSITLDRTSGMATDGDIDMTMKGSVDMKGSKVPMDMKGKIKLSNK